MNPGLKYKEKNELAFGILTWYLEKIIRMAGESRVRKILEC